MAVSSGEKFFIRTVYASAGIMAVIAGFYIYSNVMKLSSAVVKLKKVLFRMPETDAWALDLFLDVTNTSDIDIDIIGYNFDLTINGKKVATIQDKIKQSVASNSTSSIEVIAAFKPSAVWKNVGSLDFIANLVGNYQNMQIEANGVVDVAHSWLSFANLPIDYSFRLGDMLSGDASATNKAAAKK